MVIAVDLDGTLIYSDTLYETFLLLLKRNPLYLFLAVFWLLKGRAYLKQQIAQRVTLDASALPYCMSLVEQLQQLKQAGHSLVLVTAANQTIAQNIADHIGIFDAVFGSDGKRNLKSTQKRDFLNVQYGVGQYGYIGNSSADLAIWAAAKWRGVVNASPALHQKACALGEVLLYLPKPSMTAKKWLKVLRVHQYVKNLLIFLPLLLAHDFSSALDLTRTVLGFVSFSLLASSVYITNDLLDLTADRKHRSKCKRALAAGDVSIPSGVFLSLLCLVAAIILAYFMPVSFRWVLLIYYVITCLYSFGLKRITLIDVYTLAMLYTVRIFAGMAILQQGYSSWFILFSFFFFTSLAFVKRFTELQQFSKQAESVLHGRGYHVDHLLSVKMFGIGSAFAAILVFGLYLNSTQAVMMYRHPTVLYAVCPVLLYWLSRIWLKASEGKVHDDPIVYAIKDHVSYIVVGIIVLIAIVAML